MDEERSLMTDVKDALIGLILLGAVVMGLLQSIGLV